jgi:CDGSH-type Zn-finger protein
MEVITPPRCDEAENSTVNNTAVLTKSGPLCFRGNLALVALDDSDVMTDTRMTLCRCGASGNKPFCDGSHARTGFDDAGALRAPRVLPGDKPTGRLALRLNNDGPLVCTGPLTLTGADGHTAFAVTTFLCRCGGSQNKPYCDGTHARNGFRG